MSKKLYLTYLALAALAVGIIQQVVFFPSSWGNMIPAGTGSGIAFWAMSAWPTLFKSQRWATSAALFGVVVFATFYGLANPPA
ncbi:hypothetical protein [Brevundimonas diminuta]|uniref:hypothetical protein n=1 Tax=Brevundimonas diminuta TaxID=293 RepID=UPI000FE1CD85|nr:hypothetical protein [Brevundimonas diminuta]